MAEDDLLAKLFEQLLSADEQKDIDNPDTNANSGTLGGIDIDVVLKLGEVFAQMNKPDKNTQLLMALKPHLRPENRQKVDSAMKLMKILSMLPILKECGFLDGLI